MRKPSAGEIAAARADAFARRRAELECMLKALDDGNWHRAFDIGSEVPYLPNEYTLYGSAAEWRALNSGFEWKPEKWADFVVTPAP